MKSILVIIIALICHSQLKAQDTTAKRQTTDTTVAVYQKVVGKDTFIVYDLGQPTESDMGADYVKKDKDWRKYKQDVGIALTYATACKDIVVEMNTKMAEMDSRKEKRHFTKAELDRLKSQFTDKLQNLEENQGKLLVKLISRETGMTTFEIIKEVKSGWTAFWWQKFSRTMFSTNLKEVYDRNDPKNEKIERALKEMGYQN